MRCLRLDLANEQPRWFQEAPFAAELLITGYLFSLVPLTYSIYLTGAGEWIKGAALALAWVVAFPVLATALHRSRMIHIGISIFAVASILALAILIVYLGWRLRAA